MTSFHARNASYFTVPNHLLEITLVGEDALQARIVNSATPNTQLLKMSTNSKPNRDETLAFLHGVISLTASLGGLSVPENLPELWLDSGPESVFAQWER
jgi:hypothetical protein